MNFDAVGGRRYVLTWGCVIIATVLIWFDKLTGGEWVAVIAATAAAYIAGNTAQKFKSAEATNEPEINPGYQNRDRENGDRY